ncbi:MAG: hypothetical protein ACLGJC_13780 [Alphaproteobacteria bacterium]
MAERRPRIQSNAKPALTTDQKVAALVRTVDGLPPTTIIWSDTRPDAGFGEGAEPEWTATGDGSTVTIALPGRITTSPARYRVTVGGVLQPPAAYSLPDDDEALVFVEAPPDGVTIRIVAPFYGTATA